MRQPGIDHSTTSFQGRGIELLSQAEAGPVLVGLHCVPFAIVGSVLFTVGAGFHDHHPFRKCQILAGRPRHSFPRVLANRRSFSRFLASRRLAQQAPVRGEILLAGISCLHPLSRLQMPGRV